MKKLLLIFILACFLLGLIYFAYAHNGFLFLKKDRELIKISLRKDFFAKEEKELLVELVKTPESASRGLSGREAFTNTEGKAIEGMLFIFPNTTPMTFWMNEMLMNIDICWVKYPQFLSCERNTMAPKVDEKPAVFNSPQAINMVLETSPYFLTEENLELKLFFK